MRKKWGVIRLYSILAADDEPIIREGIKYLLDYEALGFTVCGEAANGEQAYERILALQPDVVLLDIRMPGLDGLEVIKRARAQGYSGNVIVISSYTDFHYAQEAMRQGVQCYITKPIDEDELQHALITFRQTLDAASQAAHYRRRARSTILEDILRGETNLTDTDIAELSLHADTYQVVMYEPYRRGAQPAGAFSELLHCPQLRGNDIEHISYQHNKILLLKGHVATAQLAALVRRGQRPAKGLPESAWYVTYGEKVASLSMIPVSYRQAQELMNRRFFSEQGQYIASFEELPKQDRRVNVISPELLEEYTRQLLDCLLSFNRRLTAETLGQLQSTLRGSADSERAIRLFFADLCLQIKEHVGRLYPGIENPFHSNSSVIRTVEQAGFLYEIVQYVAEQLERVMAVTGTSTRDSVLDDILHYISLNYAQNITLENIAPLFGYNRSYLGKIFSKKMGISFNSYVDQVRIDRAKELLLGSGTRVYSIAELVGYKNVDYFHIKFKKYTGQSPAEFRKSHKGELSIPQF